MRRLAGGFILVILAVGAFLMAVLLATAGRPETPAEVVVSLFRLAILGVVVYAVVRIALRLLRPEPELTAKDLAPRADRRPPVAPVPDTELADVPEPVTACPDCGFLGIRMLTLQDGMIPGGGELGDKMTCPRCGYQGLAIRFDTRADYGDFLRALSA